jgi:hypothetical protein
MSTDLHAIVRARVAARPAGCWVLSELAGALHHDIPSVSQREMRFLIWECINGGSLQLVQRDAEWRLTTADSNLQRARALTRFRHLLAEQRETGGTPLADLVPPPSPPRPKGDTRMTIWGDLHWFRP